ncbi:M23 family metallopeptidase [Aquiflexum gelatinilyticum]|uniref:M23 family metallopeptidase n=1 Tax=Aquiflexum gelatinilyticum TaxID=2961943 RepID=UPI0021674246|nr:M23 family metallopeptidase [Aquiflexum gelatinilyticum]MCS4433853.1 M23 family metallopeptidase [Aquiflexum gelatinilyticum]
MRYFLFLFCFTWLDLSAQVKLEAEKDANENVTLIATNTDLVPYTVKIEFTTLNNLQSSGGTITYAVANPGRGAVSRLKRINVNEGVGYNYKYTSYRGSYSAKSKEEVAYLIPVSEGVEVTIQPMTDINNTLKGETNNNNYVGISFRFENPTLICSPRKGVISQIKIDEELKGQNYSYSSLDNFIEIYHEDGTFTRLSVLKPGSAKVKLGDTVFPGQPLTESSGEKYESGPHVRMIQSRLKKYDNELKWESFPVKLYDNEKGEIQAENGKKVVSTHPIEMITKEMTKKEIKNFEGK